MRRQQFAGPAALAVLTALLHRIRHADATWPALEAADLHWWWRLDQRADARDCTVWFDEAGLPALAVTASRFHEGLLADMIRMPAATIPSEGIAVGREIVARYPDRDVSWSCATGDSLMAEACHELGAQPIDEYMVETWIDARDLPPLAACPDEYVISTRADTDPAVEHHMVARNVPDVERRLQDSQIYRADLDLWIRSRDGSPAGYALFWADLDTRVGLVEPMRVHHAHQGRGLARYLLTSGTWRLADAGCSRIKVCYMVGNPAAERTYIGAGFRPGATIQTYRNVAS